MSSVPPESLLVPLCVIIMSGKSYELWVCYHREGMTGFHTPLRANKETRMKKTFLTGKELKYFNFSLSWNFKWGEDLEFANPAVQIYIIFYGVGGWCHDDWAIKDIIMNPLLSTNKSSIIDFSPRSCRMCPCHLRPIFQMGDFGNIDLLMAFWLRPYEALLAMRSLITRTFHGLTTTYQWQNWVTLGKRCWMCWSEQMCVRL